MRKSANEKLYHCIRNHKKAYLDKAAAKGKATQGPDNAVITGPTMRTSRTDTPGLGLDKALTRQRTKAPEQRGCVTAFQGPAPSHRAYSQNKKLSYQGQLSSNMFKKSARPSSSAGSNLVGHVGSIDRATMPRLGNSATQYPVLLHPLERLHGKKDPRP